MNGVDGRPDRGPQNTSKRDEDAAEGDFLTRPGALPKYLQLSEMLTREVLAGRLKDATRLPPEREMAAELGVAVGTLRRALDTLQNNGLLNRVQGSGNYIQSGNAAQSLYRLFRLELPQGGGLPTAKVLSLKQASAPRPFAEHVPDGSQAWRVRRVRALDDIPVAVEEIWFHAPRSPKGEPDAPILIEHLSESLYLFYRQRLGIWIEAAQDSIGVSHLPPWAIDLSPDVTTGKTSPATTGYIERFAQARAGQTVEYSQTWFDPQKARYIARLA